MPVIFEIQNRFVKIDAVKFKCFVSLFLKKISIFFPALFIDYRIFLLSPGDLFMFEKCFYCSIGFEKLFIRLALKNCSIFSSNF